MPLIVPDDGSEECTIGTDFVFVNGAESFVKLTMEIQDSRGNVISRTTGLEVPTDGDTSPLSVPISSPTRCREAWTSTPDLKETLT